MALSNVLTNSGRSIKTNLVSGLGGTAPNYIGIGSGSTTAAAADTALTTEYTTGTWTGYARAHPTPTRSTTSVTNDTINWAATFTAGASQSVFEAANFDASTSGDIFIHGSFAASVGLSSGDSITINISQQES